eukprot:TRINITY_DN9865_c0_g1_i1.p1 TRINITY_DN9865_c0_g1~~TRINITY_DN9865_c0_g1_i1.p1  ORF type:complete len:201 (+),score=31.24 TRINITY_DN9865_c0_g1_i1:70-603(+)
MPEGHIHLEPSALNQLSAERQELVITARDTPVVWKAFTNNPALVSMRPSAGVIPARGKASVYAMLMSTTEKMASQIVAKPISDTELNSLSVLESLDMTAEARKLFSKVSDSLKSNHRITIAPVETPLSAEPEPLKPPPPQKSCSQPMRIIPAVLACLAAAGVFRQILKLRAADAPQE